MMTNTLNTEKKDIKELNLDEMGIISGGFSQPSAKDVVKFLETVGDWFSDWF